MENYWIIGYRYSIWSCSQTKSNSIFHFSCHRFHFLLGRSVKLVPLLFTNRFGPFAVKFCPQFISFRLLPFCFLSSLFENRFQVQYIRERNSRSVVKSCPTFYFIENVFSQKVLKSCFPIEILFCTF